jgi:hypothetical protein
MARWLTYYSVELVSQSQQVQTMAQLPTQVSMLLQALAAHLPVLLGRNLVGLYLYGSLTQRAFNPKRSDIDCLVVTERNLSEAQFRRLGAWLTQAAKSNPWVTRLQMLFLIKNEVLTLDAKACLYQFGLLKRCSSDGNPIVWLNVLKSGVVLVGPPAETFVPAITPEMLFAALKREVGYLREGISEKSRSEWRDVPSYRAYAVLTLCRILYSRRIGTIVSKPRAAKWALKHLPEKWNKLIGQALANEKGKRVAHIPLAFIKQFIAFAEAQLQVIPGQDKYRPQEK